MKSTEPPTTPTFKDEDKTQVTVLAEVEVAPRGFAEFTVATPRPLPVIILADASGSMAAAGKIESLNSAIGDMLSTFSEEDDDTAQISVAVVAFGGRARLEIPLTPANSIKFEPIIASGNTPLGAAIDLVRLMLEDTDVLSRRAYRPTILLVSDGQPTDDWEASLRALLMSERAAQATRFAMAIGDDAEIGVLQAFLGEEAPPPFAAHGARDIRRYLQFVTNTVTTRLRSANPNETLQFPLDFEDGF